MFSVAPLTLTAIGVDGCRGGWIAARGYEDPSGRLVATELTLVTELAALVAECERRRPRPTVGIDIPMGLPQRAGLRQCDRAARERLGPRWMCVYPVPDRELLDGTVERPGLSKQAISLFPRIAQAEALLRERPARQRWLIEVHPEVSFLALSGQRTPLPKKRSAAGSTARLGLLEPEVPGCARRVAAAPWPRSQVAPDDILDAYAVLWSARRYRAGQAEALGDGTRDAAGLKQRIIV